MDKELQKALEKERERQEQNIELIASENYVSKEILTLQGSILTNKYAEGYPDKRYYGGCQYIDIFEKKAIEYACKLFNSKYANVQPHSGSSANMAVYKALLNHGDKVMGMNLNHGGHLTHGYKLNFSGKDYEIISYDLDNKTEEINYDELKTLALKEKPKMIIAGASAYSRTIDFQKFREIETIKNEEMCYIDSICFLADGRLVLTDGRKIAICDKYTFETEIIIDDCYSSVYGLKNVAVLRCR